MKHPDKDYARLAASQVAETMKTVLGQQRVLGPEENIVARIRNEFYFNLLVKLERENLNIAKAKEIIIESGKAVMENKIFKKGRIYYDVDPY